MEDGRTPEKQPSWIGRLMECKNSLVTDELRSSKLSYSKTS